MRFPINNQKTKYSLRLCVPFLLTHDFLIHDLHLCDGHEQYYVHNELHVHVLKAHPLLHSTGKTQWLTILREVWLVLVLSLGICKTKTLNNYRSNINS